MMEHKNTTFFSTREWAECWSRAFPNFEPLEISVVGSGPPRTMHLIKRRLSYGLSTLSSGYFDDLYLSPGWIDKLDNATIRRIIDQLPWARTKSFTWKVRFDHVALAKSLAALNFRYREVPVAIVSLDTDYDTIFSRFNATIRNQIRASSRRGVSVRDTCDPSHINTYQSIYASVAVKKGWQVIYPARLTAQLLQIANIAHFVVAEFDGAVIAGALFLRDGNSVYYMHGVADRDFRHLYASSALIDAGLRWSLQIGAEFFNFGSWGSSQSLASFKSFWGTHIERCWIFDWDNPFWQKAAKVKKHVQVFLPKSPHTNHSQLSHATPWSQRACLGELEAVLDLNGTQRRLLLIHGAGLVAAQKAISKSRKSRGYRPVVLDFGCGTGRMVRFFGSHGCDIIGLDITVEMLKQAKKYGMPSRAWLSQFDGLSLPVKDNSIDIVWVCGVLKYTLFPPTAGCTLGVGTMDKVFVPTYLEVAREMHRVLKPGGIVANNEMWVDVKPDVFTHDFERAGFVTECVSITRKYGKLEKFCEWRESVRLPPRFVLGLGRTCARLRLFFDNPYRPGNEFCDYLFIWRKPAV